MEECIFLLFVCLCWKVSESNGDGDLGCCGMNSNGSCIYCCNSYVLVDNTCVECEGSYGYNCTESCTYPYFGSRCSQTCDCNETFCDSVNGCVADIGGVVFTKNTTDEATYPRTIEDNDIHHLRSALTGISITLCACFFTIVSLIILLYRRRRQQNDKSQTAECHELQITGQTIDESEQCTRNMKMNSYRHVGSVLGRPLPETHLYQDVEDDSPSDVCKGTNTEELHVDVPQEEKTTTYEYEKLFFENGESML